MTLELFPKYLKRKLCKLTILLQLILVIFSFENLPKVPQISLWSRIIPDAFIVSFVAYVTTFSLGKIFAKKHNYRISSNQELIALGSANIFSSFFLCYPCSGSLGRSIVQERAGGHTQITSFVSTVFIILFLLFLSPYLASLPQVRS